MSHFYGVVQGSRGEATRCGSKNSGIAATAASWNGAITVTIQYNAETGQNEYVVRERPWHGRGVCRTIATGVIGQP